MSVPPEPAAAMPDPGFARVHRRDFLLGLGAYAVLVFAAAAGLVIGGKVTASAARGVFGGTP